MTARRWLHASLFAVFALLAGCATWHEAPAPANVAEAPAPTLRPTPLLLISIDGFRADYLARGQSPTLASMAATGVRAKWMTPAFPSLTFPNHYTLVTGKYPDHHGIIGNSMYDPALGKFSLSRLKAVRDGRWWDEAEPLWVSADKQGLRTATMFWPGSEAEIRGHRPDLSLPYNGAFTGAQRVDQVLAWLDLPPAQRPDFLTLYFDHVDHAGHEYGPDTPEADAAIRDVDSSLARLVTGLRARGLYDSINIVVVSDHGMAAVPKDNNILLDKVIDLDRIHIVSMGILAGFNLKPDHADAVSAKLVGKHPHMRCWRKGKFPARLHYGTNPRTPDISCLADVHWRITTSEFLRNDKRSPALGQHGYDIDSPFMRATFIAHGPAFRQGAVIAPFPNVDVYPLLAHLLGIRAEPGDGSMAPWPAALGTPATSATP